MKDVLFWWGWTGFRCIGCEARCVEKWSEGSGHKFVVVAPGVVFAKESFLLYI